MDACRASCTVIDPKVYQAGFFTSNAEAPPGRTQSGLAIPAPLSIRISGQQLPLSRHDPLVASSFGHCRDPYGYRTCTGFGVAA
ncbi:hypothetical protein ACFX2C_023778 [Malus domestica]